MCEWLPEYGCALIAVPILGGFKTRSCNMFLVALDEWQHTVHINIQDGLRTPTSVSLAQNVIMIGTVQRSDLLRFWATFRKILDETVKQATQQRDTGKKHHKTAGQISAVAKRALSLHASAANLEPEGGYTDVGQHTGCMKRNTAWPLVQAVVSFLMEQVMQQPRQFSPVDTAAIWALFDLWNARDLMTALAPSAGSIQAADIDDVCTILQSAVMRGEDFFERGQVLWRAAWDELEQLVDDAAQRQVQRFSLLSCGDFAASHAHTRPLLRLTNASFDLQRLESTLAMKRADALRNLSSLPLLSLGCAASITALNSWLSGKLNGSNEQLELVLNTVDDWLYAKAAALFLSSSEVPASAVESLIESYRTALNNVKVSKHHSHGRMRTELRSRELLATWICYCLVHRAAGVEHPLVLTRSVCLDWSRLWVLVLSDKSAIDAQLAVCNYLQAQNARYKPVLFSLADEAATFAFAVEFGRADPELQRVLAQEKRYAEAREEKHWQEVEAKRARVAQLNVELDALLESRDELTRKLDVTPMHVELTNWKNGKTWWTRNRDYTNLGSQRESLDRVIRDKRSAIEYAERAPAAVIQPLPLDEDLALQFLFFLYTPPTLAVLACMGFMAQQMLLPRSFDDCPKGMQTISNFAFSIYPQLPVLLQTKQRFRRAWRYPTTSFP